MPNGVVIIAPCREKHRSIRLPDEPEKNRSVTYTLSRPLYSSLDGPQISNKAAPGSSRHKEKRCKKIIALQ